MGPIETRSSVLDEWRRTKRMCAYGFIAATKHGCVPNTTLAKVLVVDPRGLRQIMARDPLFVVEIREDPNPVNHGRGCPWYRLSAIGVASIKPTKLLKRLPALKRGPKPPWRI